MRHTNLGYTRLMKPKRKKIDLGNLPQPTRKKVDLNNLPEVPRKAFDELLRRASDPQKKDVKER